MIIFSSRLNFNTGFCEFKLNSFKKINKLNSFKGYIV